MTGVPEVLFVCVHNAGRSQTAAALFQRHAGGRVVVRSAGSTPASEIHPTVVQVMDEIGIDLSTEFPKPLTDDAVAASDVVITMGAATPAQSSRPSASAGQPVETVRAIRDQIDAHVRQLLTELISATA